MPIVRKYMISWTKSYLREAIMFSVGSVVVASALGFAANHFLPTSSLGPAFGHSLTAFGFMLAAFAIPIFLNPKLELAADETRIKIRSPHPFIANSVSVQTKEVKSVEFCKGTEGEDQVNLVTRSGSTIRLPTASGFPLSQLISLIQTCNGWKSDCEQAAP